MFAFFSYISNIISIIITFVVNTVKSLIMLFKFLVAAVLYLNVAIGLMPTILLAPAFAIIAISVVYIVVNR